MRCFLAKRYISRYLDGALDHKKVKRLKNHLEKCAACAALLADLNAADNLLRQKKGPEPPDVYWEEFPRRLSRLIQQKRLANVEGLPSTLKGVSGPARRLGWLAAGCVAALLVLVLIFNISLRQEIGEMRNGLEQGLTELRESFRGLEGTRNFKGIEKEVQFNQADYLRFTRIYSEVGDLFQGRVRWVMENGGKMSMEVSESGPAESKAAFMDTLTLIRFEVWREESAVSAGRQGGKATLVSAPQIIIPTGQEASLELPSLVAGDAKVYRFSIAPSLTQPGTVSLHLKFEVAEASRWTAEAASFDTHLLLGETKGLEVATLRAPGGTYRIYLSLTTQKLTEEKSAGA